MHVVLGHGDGHLSKQLTGSGEPVLTVLLGDEPDGADGVFTRVHCVEDVDELVYALYGGHRCALELASTHFHLDHPLGGAEPFRTQVWHRLCETCEHVPFLWGNSTIDTMQGICHMAANAEVLLQAPDWTSLQLGSAPVISIGAGPSVHQELDRLRELQDRCWLIACDAVVPGLRAAGIEPHLVTPLERLRSTAQKLQGGVGERSVFAGLPVVPAAARGQFLRHVYVSVCDPLYSWYGDSERAIYPGSTTGTLSVALALALGTGPVFLVGHDLCYQGASSHWGGSRSAQWHDDGYQVTVPGTAGSDVASTMSWARFRIEIGSMCADHPERVFNVARHGALIAHTSPAELPDPGLLQPLPALRLAGAPNAERYQAWRERAIWVLEDAIELVGSMQHCTELAEVQIDDLVPARNADLFAHLWRPILAQFSLERRFDRDPKRILDACKEASSNTFRALEPFFDEVSRAARQLGTRAVS